MIPGSLKRRAIFGALIDSDRDAVAGLLAQSFTLIEDTLMQLDDKDPKVYGQQLQGIADEFVERLELCVKRYNDKVLNIKAIRAEADRD